MCKGVLRSMGVESFAQEKLLKIRTQLKEESVTITIVNNNAANAWEVTHPDVGHINLGKVDFPIQNYMKETTMFNGKIITKDETKDKGQYNIMQRTGDYYDVQDLAGNSAGRIVIPEKG